jgi:hypothetical protein
MADAAAPIEEQVANLHLDEVTGEKVSKSELKKRQKQRQKEEEKKKKEAAAPPKPVKEKKSNAEADEKELNPNVSLTPLHINPSMTKLIAGYNSNTLKFARAPSTSCALRKTRAHTRISLRLTLISATL